MLGFESLFRCQKREDTRSGVFSFFDIAIEDSHHSAKGAGFAYPDRRSTSSLVRRREWVSSPKVNTPISSHNAAGVWDCRRQLPFIRSGVFSFFDIAIEDSHHSAIRRGVRIRRAERVELARKRQACESSL